MSSTTRCDACSGSFGNEHTRPPGGRGVTVFALKPISRDSIPEALQKAERYRLLNEPLEAESICRDVLEIDPGNQKAIVWLLLSLTDRIGWGRSGPADEAKSLLPKIESEYERAYYAGLICERQAKALIRDGRPNTEYRAYDRLTEALGWYERAEAARPPGNDDAILRWNTCVRILASHTNVRPEPEGERELSLLE